MPVYPRMNEEQQQDRERKRPGAEQPSRQQVREQASRKIEEARQQMARQISVTAVLQPERPLGERKRQFEANPVSPVDELIQRAVAAQNVIQSQSAAKTLAIVIERQPVIAENAEPRRKKQRKRRQRGLVRKKRRRRRR